MIEDKLISKIEAMLFAAAEPVESEKLAQLLEQDIPTIDATIAMLSAQYEQRDSGLCIVQVADKYQLCTRTEFNVQIRQLLEVKRNAPLSQAAFEVLAVIAYNQPVTRSFIEQVRGVDSSGSVSGLVEKGLIEERGRLELPGRPLVYGTTDQFLRCFCLSSLEELPDLPEKLNASDAGQIEGQTSFKEVLSERNVVDEVQELVVMNEENDD